MILVFLHMQVLLLSLKWDKQLNVNEQASKPQMLVRNSAQSPAEQRFFAAPTYHQFSKYVQKTGRKSIIFCHEKVALVKTVP